MRIKSASDVNFIYPRPCSVAKADKARENIVALYDTSHNYYEISFVVCLFTYHPIAPLTASPLLPTESSEAATVTAA
jgi:hypothetical protein